MTDNPTSDENWEESRKNFQKKWDSYGFRQEDKDKTAPPNNGSPQEPPKPIYEQFDLGPLDEAAKQQLERLRQKLSLSDKIEQCYPTMEFLPAFKDGTLHLQPYVNSGCIYQKIQTGYQI